MNPEIPRALEAIVLVADSPVESQLLAQLVELSVEEVEEALAALAAGYVEQQRGFQLVRVAGGWRFQTCNDLAPYVERFVLEGQSAKLSAAALETLAIIAYKQPISRAQIAAIRGVSVDGVVRTLEQRGYIGEVARDPGPGQAVLFGTTPEFLVKMGLDSLVAAARRSPSSCPAPTSSRRSSTACGSRSPTCRPSRATRWRPATPPTGDGGHAATRASPRRRATGARRSATCSTGTPGREPRRRRRRRAHRHLRGRRAAPEGARPGRARQPPRLRGPHRLGPGVGQRRAGGARQAGRRRARRHRPRRHAHRGQGRARLLPAQQARRGGHHRRRPPGPAHGDRPRPRRAPGVPRRPPRHGHRGPAAAHQRRRAHPPAHPSELRGRQGVRRPGRGRAHAAARCASCARASSWRTA